MKGHFPFRTDILVFIILFSLSGFFQPKPSWSANIGTISHAIHQDDAILITITIHVSLSTGENPAGTLIQLVGRDNPNLYYHQQVPESGIIVFTEVVETVYVIKAYKTGYYNYNQEYTLYVNQTLNIQLDELRYSPRKPEVNPLTLQATWSRPLAVVAETDFEEEIFPPSGWETRSGSAVGWFATNDGSSEYFIIEPHTRYAVANDDAANDNGCCDYLITPEVDLTGRNNYFLQYSGFYTGLYGHLASVEYSTDHGLTWQYLPSSAPLPFVGWITYRISLAGLSGQNGLDQVKFAFHSDDNGNWASGWAVDDVLIAADSIQVLEYALFIDGELVGTTADTAFVFENLVFGQQYTAGVAALYSSGYSAPDTCIFTSRFLFPPLNTAGVMPINTDYVHLTWDAPENPELPGQPVPGLTGYSIYRNDSLMGEITGTAYEYFDLDVQPGFHTYNITAVYDLEPYGNPGEVQESMPGEPVDISWICCNYLPFTEEFNTGLFETNQWTRGGDNWRIAGQMGNPYPSAEFYPWPGLTDYAQPLTSSSIIATGIIDGKIYLEFDLDHSPVNPTGTEFLAIEVFDGSNWIRLEEIDNLKIITWETKKYDITWFVKGKLFNIRFLAFGSDVSNIAYWRIDNINIYRACDAPEDLDGYSYYPYMPRVELYWNFAPMAPPDWLFYDDGSNYDAIGLTGGGTFYTAIRFTSQQLEQYAGRTISMFRFFPVEQGSSFKLMIWKGAGAAQLIYQQPVITYTPGAWNDIQLNLPQTILPNTEYWFGYVCNHPSYDYSAGVDNGPAVAGFGDMISLDGAIWESMVTAYGLNYNWNLRVMVESAEGGVAELMPAVDTLMANASDGKPLKAGVFKRAGLSRRAGTEKLPDNPNERTFRYFQVYRDNEPLGITEETYYIDTDSGLIPWEYYSYYVVAVYEDCEGISEEVEVRYGEISTEEVETAGLKLFPNPAEDELIIGLNNDITQIIIIDNVGRVIYSRDVKGEESVHLDVSNYKAGIYMIRYLTTKGKCFVKRFLVAG